MILADTTVWVDHLRRGNAGFEILLADGKILVHPFITGEIACGNLKNREEILTNMRALPKARVADNREVLALLDSHQLWELGLGWTDVHLLASALLSGCRLWTLDKRLARAAAKLKVV